MILILGPNEGGNLDANDYAPDTSKYDAIVEVSNGFTWKYVMDGDRDIPEEEEFMLHDLIPMIVRRTQINFQREGGKSDVSDDEGPSF